jgi:hypothetical protein
VEDRTATEFRASLARQFGFEHDVIRGGAEISRRFPQLQNLSEDRWAIYEPGGGTVLADNCLKALHVCLKPFS